VTAIKVSVQSLPMTPSRWIKAKRTKANSPTWERPRASASCL
jgi:hypothetical protein